MASPTSLVVALFCTYWPGILTFFLALHLVRNRFTRNLSQVPGPFLNSISVLPRILSVYSGKSHLDDAALHNKHGKVVRVAPHVLSVADLAAVDQIYGISTNFYKSDFWEPTRFYDEQGIVPDPLVLADKALHSRMKRSAANAYSTNALVQLEPLVDRVIERFLWRIEDRYVGKVEGCDIGEYLHYFSMDAIFSITFGNDVGFIENGDVDGSIKMLRESMAYVATAGQAPWVHRFLKGNPFVDCIISHLGSASNNSMFEKMMTIAVAQRDRTLQDMTDDPDAPCTFLKRLMLNQQKNPSSLTDREMNTHTFGNIIAGGDTTSTALRAIIANLVDHPDVADRLLKELRDAGCDRRCIPDWSTASRLAYLDAVIRESMRLHPSVGMILPRAVPPGGAVICGYKVDAGTEVGVNAWILHRDADVFFPDPDAFRPERWLEATPEKLAVMRRAWFPFGGGRHTCSGQHISLFEITKVIPSLLLRFRFVWAREGRGEGQGEKKRRRIEVTNHFFTVQSGMQVEVEMRGDY